MPELTVKVAYPRFPVIELKPETFLNMVAMWLPAFNGIDADPMVCP